MPRHWRCANGHAWTGELGALTYCPDCGSADVYEVRPQYESTGTAPVPASADTPVDPALAEPAVAPLGVGNTLVQTPALSVGVGDTFIQPATGTVRDPVCEPPNPGTTLHQAYDPEGDGGTLDQAPDPGTTQEQIYIPDGDGGTLIQSPADDDMTLVQAPVQKVPSTLDLVLDGADAATLDQPAAGGPAADGPTLLAEKALPDAGTSRMNPGGLADGGSIPPHPADAPTLDAPSGGLPPHRTADYPSTVSVHRPGDGRPLGISGMDTRLSPPVRTRPAAAPDVSGYDILGVLGRGGMGVVYKARQVKLNRIVALKMILAGGHAGTYERQRFVTEMEAVAHLQHPNIVQIYETGERDGLPYFTLEFCDGGSLQQKLGGQPIPPKAAADVAEQLSRAMQYAHERGVVHRDLKPANILFAGDEAAIGRDKAAASKDSKLASRDGKTRDPKTPRDANKETLQSKASQAKSGHSATGSRAGGSTSSMRSSRVIPKITDFGLAKRLENDSGLTGSGTILGTPSYMAPEQAEGRSRAVGPPADIHALGAILYEMLTGRPPFLGDNVVETMNQVRTMDPVPPTHIQPKTPKDLETICLKCLQKEMHKRYASAGDLADDLHHFLDGEPIAARPVQVWEKGWKWAKRRPAQAALIAMSAAVLIGVSVGGWGMARRERQQALAQEKLKEEAIAQKELAEANFMSARDAVDNLLVRIGAERLEGVPKAEKLRKELLEQSLTFYDRFLTTHGDDPAVRREAGWAYQRVGHIRNDLGDRKAAIAAYQKAADLFEPLTHESTEKQGRDRFDLAQTYRQLAVIFEAESNLPEADAAYQAALAGLRTLAEENGGNSEYRAQLCQLLIDRGSQLISRRRLIEAEETYRQALAESDQLCRNDPTPENLFNRAKTQASLGTVILVAGRTGPAIAELDKAVEMLTAVARTYPENPEHVKDLGQAMVNVGTALWQSGDVEKAKQKYRESIDRLTKLTADFPNIHDYRFTLAKAHDNLAMLLLNNEGLKAAEPEREKARELYKQLTEQFSDNPEYRFHYSLDRDHYAIFLAQTDRLPEAIAEETAAVRLMQALVANDPSNPEWASNYAKRRLNLGQLFARSNRPDEAAAEYAQAAALFEGLADRRLRDDEFWIDLPDVYINEAQVFINLRLDRAAERAMRKAVAVRERIATGHPDQPDALAKSAFAQANLSVLPTVKPAEALNLLREAVRWQKAALALAPRRGDLAKDLGHYSLTLMVRLNDQGDHAGAVKEAADLAKKVTFEWNGWASVVNQLARCVRLARTDKSLSDEQKAKLSTAYGEQALDLLRKAVAAGFKNATALKESPELEVLRTDPAFRDQFEKVLANIKP